MADIQYHFKFDQVEQKIIVSNVLSGIITVIIMETDYIEIEEITKKYLTNIEFNRMEKYIKVSDQLNYLISHSIINLVFSKILNCDIDKLKHYKTISNKPYIKNNQNIEFNISHSKNCIAVAFAKNKIGIDLEYIDCSFEFSDMLENIFSIEESKMINNDVNLFFENWVSKEAYLKYEGSGLLKDIRVLKVLKDENEKIIIKDNESIIEKEIIIKRIFADYYVGICF